MRVLTPTLKQRHTNDAYILVAWLSCPLMQGVMYATHVLENINNCLNQRGFNAADKLMIGR